MRYGLQIHRQAVMIEHYLNQSIAKLQGEGGCADITMVYDQPVRHAADILTAIEAHHVDDKEQQTIEDIKRKYCGYHGYLLSQLDEEVCEALVADLKKLCE